MVTDDLPGAWWIKDPIDEAMGRYRTKRSTVRMVPVFDSPDYPGSPLRKVAFFDEPWWWKYREGLDCPHCVGFWIGAGLIAADSVLHDRPWWRGLTWALALNAVVAPAGTAVGYWGDDEEDQ